MKTVTITEARKSWFKLLYGVAESHSPIKITGKERSAVVVGEDDWRAIEETLYLLSIPGMRKSIMKGLKTPVNECSSELKW